MPFPVLEHLVCASAIASTSKGSRPLGNAPAWRDTRYVPLPTATAPVLCVAHAVSTSGMVNTNAAFKPKLLMAAMGDGSYV